MGRFGRLLFSLAIVGIGVETLICSYLSDHKVVPVIPWLPAIPGLTYLVVAILVVCWPALVLDCFLRRRLHSRGRKLRHWISATMGGFRYGTDVRALDGNNSPTARSQLFPHPRRNSRSGQVVGRLHCRSAMGRLLGAVAR